jgi:hypothetical protein
VCYDDDDGPVTTCHFAESDCRASETQLGHALSHGCGAPSEVLSALSLYRNGRMLLDVGVVSGFDMTTEAALALDDRR